MGAIVIEMVSITECTTDAVVNAANAGLAPGAGVCGAIFAAAGYDQLDRACRQIGGCPTGGAVITPGFNLSAKYIVHAVGPIWHGGSSDEPQLLYGAYANSLVVAWDHQCTSIAFPLISAGIYGYPLEGAWDRALRASADFIMEHDMDIVFAVLDRRIMDAGVAQMKALIKEDKYKDFTGFKNIN